MIVEEQDRVRDRTNVARRKTNNQEIITVTRGCDNELVSNEKRQSARPTLRITGYAGCSRETHPRIIRQVGAQICVHSPRVRSRLLAAGARAAVREKTPVKPIKADCADRRVAEEKRSRKPLPRG